MILDVACNRVNDDGSDGERILSAEQKGSRFLLDLISVVSDLKSHLLRKKVLYFFFWFTRSFMLLQMSKT